MRAAEALIAWTPNKDYEADSPTRGQIKVGPLLHHGMADWTLPYRCTGGAAYAHRRSIDGWRQIAMIFIEFNSLVLMHDMDPKVVHEAFLAIDEYRQRISPDLPGAEETPEGEHD